MRDKENGEKKGKETKKLKKSEKKKVKNEKARRKKRNRMKGGMELQMKEKMIEGECFDVEERFVPLEVLGKGAYGVVVRAYDKKEKKEVAIKKIKEIFLDPLDTKKVLRELKILKHFRGKENVCISHFFFSFGIFLEIDNLKLLSSFFQTITKGCLCQSNILANE